MAHQDIPKLFLKLFQWLCNDEYFEELQGDLEESFMRNVKRYGKKKARFLYKIEVLKMIRPSVLKPLIVFPSGFGQLTGNYAMTSFRAFKLNPFYISANVLSLSLALSICTIGYFNHRFNATFNYYFEEAPELYKVHGIRLGQSTVGSSPVLLAPNLKSAGFKAVRYHSENIALKLNNRLFKEKTAFIDTDFLKHFSLKNMEGRQLSLSGSDEILISESTALKFFGKANPVGQLVNLVFPNQKEVSFKIKDVFIDPPKNISFHFSIITPINNYFKLYGKDEYDWPTWVDATFVKLDGQSSESIEMYLDGLLSIQNEKNKGLTISAYSLDNILDWPNFEHELYESNFRSPLHPASVVGTVSSAIAILLLACFNFINTSISLSGRRLKEIAIRKVMGGSRKSTITQFMVENMMLILLSAILSIGISFFLIPAYNAMYQMELIQLDKISYTTLIMFGIGVIIIAGLVAAAYPSLYISKFPSVAIFRDKVVLSGKNRLMFVLLTFQFALCFYNTFGLLLFVDNAHYQKTLDRGYIINDIINIPLNDPGKYSILKDELNKNPEILSVAGTDNLIGFTYNRKAIEYNSVEHQVANLRVGKEYLETLGVRLNKGNYFISDTQQSTKHIVINQMLENQIGIDMLGQPLSIDDEKYTVMGVVDDFNLRSIMFDNKIQATVIQLVPESGYQYASVRTTKNSLPKTKIYLEDLWYELYPQELYQGFLQQDVLENVSDTNRIMLRIYIFLAVVSIIISVLGLYTLISLIAQRKSKEFGIRKVLGASAQTILALMSRDLYWIMFISSVIGLAGSYYVMNLVFDIIYAYHIDTEVIHFTSSILIILLTVTATIGYKVFITARINPVEQLRDE